jgi:hypothetical protein
MPILDQNLDAYDVDGTGYGFSGTRLENLGASEYTLVGLAVDTSSSVSPYQAEIERCVGHIVDACRSAPRADNLMFRVTRFDSQVGEVHGFKPLRECAPGSYQNALPCQGCTALYDGVYNAVESVRRYGTDLTRHGLTANGIIFVITDGCDNASSLGDNSVRKAIADLKQSELVEGITTVLVAVGVENAQVAQTLKDFAAQVGFDGYVDLGSADPSALAGLANFVSRHISLQSRMLGSGQSAAVSLTF